jgi:hypothetical protein
MPTALERPQACSAQSFAITGPGRACRKRPGAPANVSHDVISKIETGERPPAEDFPPRLDAIPELGTNEALTRLYATTNPLSQCHRAPSIETAKPNLGASGRIHLKLRPPLNACPQGVTWWDKGPNWR